MAIEDLHRLPNELLYGPTYVMQSPGEIEEVFAFQELIAEMRQKQREVDEAKDTYGS